MMPGPGAGAHISRTISLHGADRRATGAAAPPGLPLLPLRSRTMHCAGLGRDPHLQRGGERRRHRPRHGRRARASWSRRPSHPDRRRQLSGRDRAASPIGWPRPCRRSRCCTARPRPAWDMPTWPGSRRALRGDAELVIEMDADFSHDPRYLEPLLEAAEEADLVLGSRYVEGGGVEDWGIVAPADQPRGLPVRADDPRRPDPRPHRRLQVHPPAGARGDLSSRRSGPRGTFSRSRSPTARCWPGSGSPRSRSCSETAASAPARCRPGSRPRRCGPCPSCADAAAAEDEETFDLKAQSGRLATGNGKA